MKQIIFVLFLVTCISASLPRGQIVPSGTRVDVGIDTLTIKQPNGVELVKQKQNAHRTRDDGHVAFLTNSTDGDGFSFFSGEFQVPAKPVDQLNNIVYFFPALVSDTNEGLMVVLTFYGDFKENNEWTLSIYGGGVQTSDKVVKVGDNITAYFVQIGSSGWNVSALVNGKMSSSIFANFATPQRFTDLELYLQVHNVRFCENYPASGFIQTNKISLKKGVNSVVPQFQHNITAAQSAQCNLQITSTSNSARISWNNFNAPPTPTPEPLQYSYVCPSTTNQTETYPNSPNGVIRSNPAGTNYINNLNCAYTFTAPAGKVVQIQFTSLALGKSGGGDVVTVYKGPDTSYPIIFRRHGEGNNPLVVSTVRVVHLVFRSDAANVYNGFVASFSYVNAPPAQATYTCGPNESVYPVLTPTGYIRANNPSSDANYFNNVRCSFFLSAPAGKKISFEFSRLALAAGKKDYLIYDGADSTAAALLNVSSSPSTPPKKTTTQEKAFVYFFTDASVTAGGFNALYKFI